MNQFLEAKMKRIKVTGVWKKIPVICLCFIFSVCVMLLPVCVHAAPKDRKTETVKDKDSKGRDEIYTVTLDGNGKSGTLWTYKVPAGMSLNDFIESSDDPKYLWSKYYQEIDVDGKHYRVQQYTVNSSEDDSDKPPFIALTGTTRFSLTQPITEDITIYALWEERIERIDLTITLPDDEPEVFTPGGDDVWLWYDQTNPPRITVPENEGYSLCGDYEFDVPAYWIADESGEIPFNGFIESGKKYLLMVYFTTEGGYYLSKDTEVSVTNGKFVRNCLEEDDSVILRTDRIPGKEKKEPASEEKPEPDSKPESEEKSEETGSEITEDTSVPKTSESPKVPGVVKEPGSVKTPEKTSEKESKKETEEAAETGVREKKPGPEKDEDIIKSEAESEKTVTGTETVSDSNASEENSETETNPDELKERNYLPVIIAAAGVIAVLIGGGLVLILKITKNRKA